MEETIFIVASQPASFPPFYVRAVAVVGVYIVFALLGAALLCASLFKKKRKKEK